MSFRAVDHSVNVIAYVKEERKYAMCCAWMMMADYDKLLCLIGSQSSTGRHLQAGDIIGVSSLNRKQKEIAATLGEKHSDETDKLQGIPFTRKRTAILIEGAATEMVCEVIDVLHLPEIETDNLVYLRILEHKQNQGSFLHMENL